MSQPSGAFGWYPPPIPSQPEPPPGWDRSVPTVGCGVTTGEQMDAKKLVAQRKKELDEAERQLSIARTHHEACLLAYQRVAGLIEKPKANEPSAG